jgi:hypothetical protein
MIFCHLHKKSDRLIEDISTHVKRCIEDFKNELNDSEPIADYFVLHQTRIYNNLLIKNKSSKININILLSNYGMVKEPYKCYYGTTSATDLADLWAKYNPFIFSPNIRNFLGQSDVNKEIINTLKHDPNDFFFFNNGITLLCDEITRSLKGGNNKESGLFECTNTFVINGAQTLGAIGTEYQANPNNIDNARVMVRIISLENTPDNFDKLITKATNTQNKVEARDFITQDPEHERLKMELSALGINYLYKRGETSENLQDSFTFEEAMIALACSKDKINYPLQIKSYIGQFWENINKAPYKDLINDELTGIKMWCLVQIFRVIDKKINDNIHNSTGRKKSILTHGNRFITYLVYKKLDLKTIISKNKIDSEEIRNIQIFTDNIGGKIVSIVENLYPDGMLACLFRNATKCENVLSEYKNSTTSLPTEGLLFE